MKPFPKAKFGREKRWKKKWGPERPCNHNLDSGYTATLHLRGLETCQYGGRMDWALIRWPRTPAKAIFRDTFTVYSKWIIVDQDSREFWPAVAVHVPHFCVMFVCLTFPPGSQLESLAQRFWSSSRPGRPALQRCAWPTSGDLGATLANIIILL